MVRRPLDAQAHAGPLGALDPRHGAVEVAGPHPHAVHRHEDVALADARPRRRAPGERAGHDDLRPAPRDLEADAEIEPVVVRLQRLERLGVEVLRVGVVQVGQ